MMKDCAEGLCRKDCRLQWKERSLRESACEGIWVEELLWEEMCVLRVPGFHILILLILCMHLQNVSHLEIVALLLAHYWVWEVLHPWSI